MKKLSMCIRAKESVSKSSKPHLFSLGGVVPRKVSHEWLPTLSENNRNSCSRRPVELNGHLVDAARFLCSDYLGSTAGLLTRHSARSVSRNDFLNCSFKNAYIIGLQMVFENASHTATRGNDEESLACRSSVSRTLYTAKGSQQTLNAKIVTSNILTSFSCS